jgi:hypothetical protein
MDEMMDFKGYFNPFKPVYLILGYLPYFVIIGEI